jgi:hypothetical protein
MWETRVPGSCPAIRAVNRLNAFGLQGADGARRRSTLKYMTREYAPLLQIMLN